MDIDLSKNISAKKKKTESKKKEIHYNIVKDILEGTDADGKETLSKRTKMTAKERK
jgi:hypothetical protein